VQRLRMEYGFTGGITIVGEAVRELRQKSKEVFMPLVHRPGEAHVDFGQPVVRMDGVLRKASFFVMALPHSDAFFVMAFPSECTATFLEGHVRAFAFFGAVPRRITYDNNRVCISKIIGILSDTACFRPPLKKTELSLITVGRGSSLHIFCPMSRISLFVHFFIYPSKSRMSNAECPMLKGRN
jgi:transposase